jgi:hypothetical protein
MIHKKHPLSSTSSRLMRSLKKRTYLFYFSVLRRIQNHRVRMRKKSLLSGQTQRFTSKPFGETALPHVLWTK